MPRDPAASSGLREQWPRLQPQARAARISWLGVRGPHVAGLREGGRGGCLADRAAQVELRRPASGADGKVGNGRAELTVCHRLTFTNGAFISLGT